MRTTLKRGIGRSGVSGDGNGNGAPTLPPAVITPMSRYRQPEPPRRTKLGWAGRIVLWVLAAILVLGAAFAGGTYLYFNREVQAVRAHTADVKIAQKRLSIPLPGQPAIALIAGYDHRANEGKGAPSRSDTVMLLRADPQEKAISMLSFPRDMIVNVVCPGKPTFRGRINAAYNECGAQGTLETVKDLTGLPINYLITVNFHGFKQIVDKIGGVWMDIDRRYYNKNTGSAATNYADIDLHAGYQRLNGSNALSFVRFRHTDSDFYRVIRQQMFVKALKQQIQHNFSPFKLPGIVGAITKNVEVGVGGGDGLTGKTVLSYALFAYGLPAGHFFQAKIQGLSGYSSVSTSDQNLQDAIREFTTPDVAAPTKATDVTLGRKIRSAAPRPQNTTLLVLNGNGVTGSAATAGYAFARRGYQIVVPPAGKPANAPTFDYFHSTVYFDATRPRREGRGDGGREPVRRRRRRGAPGDHPLVRLVARRRRGPDVPRLDRAGSGRPDAEAGEGERPLQPGALPQPRPRRPAPAALQGDGAHGDGALVGARHGGAEPRLLARQAPCAPARLPDRRHRVLGDRGDQLDGRADPGRQELDAQAQGAPVRPLLLGPAPPHGRPPLERRHVLGREHAPGHVVQRDDARDR